MKILEENILETKPVKTKSIFKIFLGIKDNKNNSQSYPQAFVMMNQLTAIAIMGRPTNMKIAAHVIPMSRCIVLCKANTKQNVEMKNRKFRNRCKTMNKKKKMREL